MKEDTDVGTTNDQISFFLLSSLSQTHVSDYQCEKLATPEPIMLPTTKFDISKVFLKIEQDQETQVQHSLDIKFQESSTE